MNCLMCKREACVCEAKATEVKGGCVAIFLQYEDYIDMSVAAEESTRLTALVGVPVQLVGGCKVVPVYREAPPSKDSAVDKRAEWRAMSKASVKQFVDAPLGLEEEMPKPLNPGHVIELSGQWEKVVKPPQHVIDAMFDRVDAHQVAVDNLIDANADTPKVVAVSAEAQVPLTKADRDWLDLCSVTTEPGQTVIDMEKADWNNKTVYVWRNLGDHPTLLYIHSEPPTVQPENDAWAQRSKGQLVGDARTMIYAVSREKMDLLPKAGVVYRWDLKQLAEVFDPSTVDSIKKALGVS